MHQLSTKQAAENFLKLKNTYNLSPTTYNLYPMIEATLTSLGLSEKEIAVYLAILGLGTSPVSPIAKRTELARSSTQYLCNELVEKGLLSITKKGNTVYYAPDDPEKLYFLLDRKMAQLKNQRELVDRIIQNLKARMNPYNTLPKVKFYEGHDGVIKAYRDLIEDIHENEALIGYGTGHEELDDVNRDAAFFIPERIRKNVFLRIIVPFSEKAVKSKFEDDAKMKRQSLLVHPQSFPISYSHLFWYEDKSWAFTAHQEQYFAYMVQNKNMVEMQKFLFEQAWNNALREDEEICKKLKKVQKN